ncbi:MAG: Coenzyme F420 hydrogenase/dehydrogenase, beta subunit C-terminal domain [Dehalococcoidales bacterium]|nr:MAG: Coenzyme F420 hydrogenase/dehydrogenase, beta subunit C-terminal domain [Dehalococcoidales bacterium]
MAKSATLAVKDGKIRSSINALLADLLSKQVVEAVLVPLAHPAGNNVVQSLVTNPDYLEQADVFAPVMPVNAGRIIQAMTRLTPANKKTAVVMRPCELRALVELVKLRQAQLDNLYLIGIDCPGAYSVSDYPKYAAEKTSDDFVKAAWNGKDDPMLRAGCQVCEYPVPLMTDLTIGSVGQDLKKQLLLLASTEKGEELLEGLGLTAEEDSQAAAQRHTAVDQLLNKIKETREKFFEQTREEIGGADKLATVFGPCIKCQNCRVACPVCYCRECFFVSPTFELEAEKYLGAAEKRGAMRMPTDTLLFHLTRMTHMAASCIGCGACEEACPNAIPLLKIFQLTGTNVQKLFDYIPGRSLEDELPPTAFKEDELEWIGEK